MKKINMRGTSIFLFAFLAVLAEMNLSVDSVTVSLVDTSNKDLLTMPRDQPAHCRLEESVNLSGLRMMHWPQNIVRSDHIMSINLDSNSLTEIPKDSLDAVTNLLCLNLSNNNIPIDKPIAFGHPKLKFLDLSYQKGNSLNYDEWSSEVIENKELKFLAGSSFPSLQYLDLSGNEFNFLSRDFQEVFPQLTHLYLMNRNIANVDSDAFNYLPPSIKSLHFENNNLTYIILPDHLPIEALFYDGNPLWEYGHRLRNNYLKILSLSNCKLSSIEMDMLHDLPNLISLDLSGNSFNNSFPIKSFSILGVLQKLSLSHNKYSSFPYEGRFTRLEELSLNYNQISSISNVAHGFPFLRRLHLKGNKIRDIAVDAFIAMTNLQLLDLSENHLQHIPSLWIQPMTSLNLLDLRHNKFDNLIDMFGRRSIKNQTNLRDLYIKSNSIKSITEVELKYLPDMCTLHVA